MIDLILKLFILLLRTTEKLLEHGVMTILEGRVASTMKDKYRNKQSNAKS